MTLPILDLKDVVGVCISTSSFGTSFFGTLILKAYCSVYGMNEDFSLKLPIEGFQNLHFPASDMRISNKLEQG